jgi:hypothetical protein
LRTGSTRGPSTIASRTVPAGNGIPTTAKLKNPKAPAPAPRAASETMTLTGLPVRASRDPACAANATGSSIWDGVTRARAATTMTIGRRAATAPFGVMSAVRTSTTPPAAGSR